MSVKDSKRVTVVLDQDTIRKCNQISDSLKLSRSAVIRTIVNDVHSKMAESQSLSLRFLCNDR